MPPLPSVARMTRYASGGRVVQIVILAMIFLFVGPPAVERPGRRHGDEQPIAEPDEVPARPRRSAARRRRRAADGSASPIESRATDGLRAIAAADEHFDAARFLEGAGRLSHGARRLSEGRYHGARPAHDQGFRCLRGRPSRSARRPGTARNRMIAIERAAIERASLNGQMASITALRRRYRRRDARCRWQRHRRIADGCGQTHDV